jgi:hypothetical protein
MSSLAIRPAWSPLTVILTILGFIIFWPLGVAMLVYVIWGDRIRRELADIRARMRGVDLGVSFADFKSRGGFGGFGSSGFGGFAPTGNSAFDEYRAATLRRLEEERRKLAEEQRAFEEFLRSLRQARDKEEFDRFMAERTRRRDGQSDQTSAS